MNNRPAIIIKSQFQLTTAQASQTSRSPFTNYLNYMDRLKTHAKENEYEQYQDYMNNEEKSTGLFTNRNNALTEIEKEQLKDIFKEAQHNGSVLWQDVISFDNEWLQEIGVVQGTYIDEKKLQQATRNAVNEMLKKEGLMDSAIWTAAIHYNTDNIHIHVATVQTKNFRERGKRKPKSIETMKSKVAHTLLDRSKENAKLNEFIREKVIRSKRTDELTSMKNRVFNRDMVKQFKKVHSLLPEDKRLWQYNMNGIQSVRPEINKLTDMYIQKHFKQDFQAFQKQLEKEVEFYKRTYGDTKKAEQYRHTKMNDLYTRMGNTLLKEIKQYDYSETTVHQPKTSNKLLKSRELNNVMYRVSRYMNDDLQHLKNQRSYEQLQHEQEIER